MSESTGFNLLHKNVQRWIWAQNWTNLRDIQEQAIAPILRADCDVIISAATASGKTEAAFLPACSRIAESRPDGVGILYISPLKALINDQFRRLQSLCELMSLQLTPWHGDVLRSVKSDQKKSPGGIILITPESLESMLLNHAGWCNTAFSSLSHIIIDEFHAFVGTERGCQLQSLMHRIEFMLGRIVPRVALSATMGDMEQVARYLRSSIKNFPCEIIESGISRSDLKIQQRGYLIKAEADEELPGTFEEIVSDLYNILRKKSHLIFANSRRLTEMISVSLSELCEKNGVPNEFFPHHGNLSKEIREALETRLQADKLPTSAVCTMTLELGIDVGSVDSIAQITAPHSVASLRQRLGRSGRRGNASILRLFIIEKELTANSHLSDRLRIETVQCIAMINLLLQKWCEPAPDNQYHLSTLVQQTLSVIGQYGGVRANQLWSLLCESGPFCLVNQNIFSDFLRGLGKHELITQMRDGQLVLGTKGERLVENYDFYTAFQSPEEYRLECEARTIGTVPVSTLLTTGQIIVFAGKRWQILNIILEKKVITLRKAVGGQPPKFHNEGQLLHDTVRQEMRRVYVEKLIPGYLNNTAKDALTEAIECFHTLKLQNKSLLQTGNNLHLLTWRGDQITSTIARLLQRTGLNAYSYGAGIEINRCSLEAFGKSVKALLIDKWPTPDELAREIPDTVVEKHDRFIPKDLRDLAYGRKYFDVDGAMLALKSIAEESIHE